MCLLMLLVVTTNLAKWRHLERLEIEHEFRIAEQGRDHGERLGALFAARELPCVAVTEAGGIKCSYRGPVFDMLGINDETVAHHHGNRSGMPGHAAFSREIFFVKQPEVVLPQVLKYRGNPQPHSPGSWENGVLGGLLWEEQFMDQYAFARIRAHQTEAPTADYFAYFRRDFLQELMGDGSYEVELIPYGRRKRRPRSGM